jgi:hypothetical protein
MFGVQGWGERWKIRNQKSNIKNTCQDSKMVQKKKRATGDNTEIGGRGIGYRRLLVKRDLYLVSGISYLVKRVSARKTKALNPKS